MDAGETFDLEQTQTIAALAAVPAEKRDDAWCQSFLSAVSNASLASFTPQIEEGPDTFPYFQLAVPDTGPFTPFSIVHILNDDVLCHGTGLVIHATSVATGSRYGSSASATFFLIRCSRISEATLTSSRIRTVRPTKMIATSCEPLLANRISPRPPARRWDDSCADRLR
jgi:hypothetical protein